ncbi:MAG: DUF433 domain-containing protein [Candidatus Dormibacteria bacterium]
MTLQYNQIYEEPAYGLSEAAAYLKIPYQTLRYWLTGFRRRPAVVDPAESNPVHLSFSNLLECQVLAGIRKIYDVKLPKVRTALSQITEKYPQPHPLITQEFLTDGKNLFIEEVGRIINVSQPEQMQLNLYEMYLERIKVDPNGLLKFFPFVVKPGSTEPKSIEINPLVGFGKPVIAGTGISTAIIASRFNARDSISDLAAEYGCSPQQIEEAVRWELPLPVAA